MNESWLWCPNHPEILEEIITLTERYTPMLSTHDYVTDINEAQRSNCEAVRRAFKELESMLKLLPVNGTRTAADRFLSIARTKLEEASMYAIKAIVFEGKEVG